MSDLEDTASDLVDQLAENDIDAEQDEVLERLDSMVNEYSVPETEARRSVLRHYADEHDVEIEGINDGGGGGGASDTNVEAITTADEWVNVEVKVVDLWDSDSDSVKQTGLAADETGRIKFTAWSESDLDLLEEGGVYRLENVVTDEYQGRMSIQLNSSTEITPLDTDIDAAERDTTETYGVIVDIQSGSGLIKRCPVDDCTRVLNSERCSEHGDVDGEFDLRVKAVLDDGLDVQDVLFDREATEEVVGISLQDAKDRAQEALDTSVVAQDITDELVGRYYAVEGTIVGRYLLVDDAEELSEPDPSDVLDRLEGEA